ncbi:Uncharacterized protein dnm_045530 [Desulfonema magnum]|uniref:Uncharacterized protein n=1 Tax=Desulfonema magnum TaxID=45655 RepID=A0A975BMY9_9BACT|nr:Uncharacterized protein dnm_045530 [Desulfonema magnum]
MSTASMGLIFFANSGEIRLFPSRAADPSGKKTGLLPR